MSQSTFEWWSRPSTALRYGVAVAAAAAALLAGALLERFLHTAPFVSLFLCAIMFVSWFGGAGPGVLAAVLSILAFDIYFVPPAGSFIVALKDLPRIALFALAAAFVVWLSASQRNTAISLRRARDELQAALLDQARVYAELKAENEERKQAERNLRKAEQSLQMTIDTIPAMAVSYRADGSRDFVNRTWREYTGLSISDLEGQHWGFAVHPDDLERIEREWRVHTATGEPFQIQQRLRRADGEYRWHQISRVPLRDEKGNVIKWYGAGYDIEDQKRAEDALRRSEANLTEAQRLSRTGSFGWKPARGQVVWSDETYRIMDFDRSVTPTIEAILARIHPEDRPLVQSHIERAREGAREFDYENRLVAPDGTIKYVHVRARRMKYESGEEEILGAIVDVTEARQAQEALQTAQAELAHVARVTALGEMTASIAHEVNQPLAAIVTYGEASMRWLTRETPDVEEALRALRRIVREANRAGDVIKKVRELARKAEPEMTALDINYVVNEVTALLQREVWSRHISLRLDLAPGLPSVRGDRIQLQQVIINLAINGVQAMAGVIDRPRALTIRTQQHDADHVVVAVRDTGVGIAPENLEKLFNTFYTTKPDGMGMGLSICRSIVEAHAGHISAARNDGPGMNFQFTLPAYRADE